MTSNQPRVLITGVTGLLGNSLAREVRHYGQVYGLARHIRLGQLPGTMFTTDLLDPTSLKNIINEISPDLVIHTAALSSVDTCESDPVLAERANVDATRNLLKILPKHGCRFVLISTDAVFDGKFGNYAEDAVPAPINVYGQTKLRAEQETLSSRPDSLVIRTAFYGRNLLPKESLSEWILNRLRSGRRVPGFMDVRFSPLFTVHLARLIVVAASKTVTGVLHLASSESCSKYQFAQSLALAAGFDEERVYPVTLESAGLRAPRPRDLSLQSVYAAKVLGEPLPSVSDGVAAFVHEVVSSH